MFTSTRNFRNRLGKMRIKFPSARVGGGVFETGKIPTEEYFLLKTGVLVPASKRYLQISELTKSATN